MKKKESLPLIYILGLPIILVVSSFVAHKHLLLHGTPLYLYAFIYPLTYFMSCLIRKKTNLNIALAMMSLALITQTLIFVLQWALVNKMDGFLMICTFLSFLLEQIILIFGYDFLVNAKKETYMPIFILLLIVGAIGSAFFGVMIEGFFISLSILPRLAYVVILPAFLAEKDKTKKDNE